VRGFVVNPGASLGSHGLGIPIPRGQSIADQPKRRPGRPATGKDPVLSVRIPAELHAAVAAWIESQPEPKPSRSEAVRRLLEKALG